MAPRRRIDPFAGAAAVAAWSADPGVDTDTIATAVRFTLEELGIRAPGRSVEMRVPPYGAVQCIEGPAHKRGTPPNVTETDAATWLGLATGTLDWATAEADGALRVSGSRADLHAILPLIDPPTPRG